MHPAQASPTSTGDGRIDGEQLHVLERVLISPTAGTFQPLELAPDLVEIDDVVGHVRTNDALVPVRSAFRGRVIQVVASAGQRMQPHERIAWLRVA